MNATYATYERRVCIYQGTQNSRSITFTCLISGWGYVYSSLGHSKTPPFIRDPPFIWHLRVVFFNSGQFPGRKGTTDLTILTPVYSTVSTLSSSFKDQRKFHQRSGNIKGQSPPKSSSCPRSPKTISS